MNQYENIEQVKETYRRKLWDSNPTPSVKPVPQKKWFPKVEKIFAFTLNHLYNPKLTVNWMKEQCDIKSPLFSAIFQRYTGRYPQDYIVYHRIETAKCLLKQTGATATSIALSVGYKSLSAMCKAFKRRVGVRPSKWRRKPTRGNKV